MEESSHNVSTKSEFMWVVDSIAGTIHFQGRLPYFGLNIGLTQNKVPIFGLNYTPYTGDLYFALKDHGAYHQNKRFNINKKLQVNTINDPSQGILLVDSGNSREKRLHTATLFKNLNPHFRQVDKFSDSKEAGLLGETNVVGYVCNEAFYWDFIAHKLIIEESGGKTSDFKGKELDENFESVVHSNGLLHNYLLELIK